MAYPGHGWAEFNLNWTANTPDPGFQGTTIEHGGTDAGFPGAIILTNQTPFIYERVTDANGQDYYHLVVGDPAQGFAQEVYIRVGFNGGAPDFYRGIGDQDSASAGFGQGSGDGTAEGNAIDPLGRQLERYNPITLEGTGIGTGSPTLVQMRQIMNDGALSTEFVKSRFAEKPSIRNNIDTGDFRSVFAIDATGLTYNNGSTPAGITNTTEIIAPGIGSPNARFDVSASAQRPHVTAAQYTYSNGPATRGAAGTYTYSEGSANLDIDWSSYFDHSVANPWAYTENRPTPP